MKIRLDFVTNSSSSSFVACGVMSEEFASFVSDLLNGETKSFSKTHVGILKIDNNIVSVASTLNMPGFYIHRQDGYDRRSESEQRADTQEVTKPENLAEIFSDFLPQMTPQQHEKFIQLLTDAVEDREVLGKTYIDATDCYEPPYFPSYDFLKNRFVWDDFGRAVQYIESSKNEQTTKIPWGVTIEAGAFSHCKKITHILMDSHAKPAPGAFARCRSLQKATLSGCRNAIPKRLCAECENLREVELPETLYCIHEEAFAGCTELESINIPDSIMFIHETAFNGCDKLPAAIKERVKSVSDEAAFYKRISDAEQYIRTHGRSSYQLNGENYGSLLTLQADYAKWHEVFDSCFDFPDSLPKGKIKFNVYGNYSPAMGQYGWIRQKEFSPVLQVLIVDTDEIINFDRFQGKQAAIEAGDERLVKHYGNSLLEKAINLKREGKPVQIITKAHLEACISANAFSEVAVTPSIAELHALEQKKRREEEQERKKARREEEQEREKARQAQEAADFDRLIIAVQEHCKNTGSRFNNLTEIYRFARGFGIALDNYTKTVQQTHNVTLNQYFTNLGAIATAETRLHDVLSVLSERYKNSAKKPATIAQLADENPDLDINVISNYAKPCFGLTAKDLLIQKDILCDDSKPVIPSDCQPRDRSQVPANIQKRMDTLFAKLNEAYPDAIISNLQRDHKKWAETVTDLYRALGYGSPKEFLTAYGYIYDTNTKGGRPSKDPMEIIRELQRRYPNGAHFSSINELRAANHDIAGSFGNLQNKATEYFGMTFVKYLRSIGLIK